MLRQGSWTFANPARDPPCTVMSDDSSGSLGQKNHPRFHDRSLLLMLEMLRPSTCQWTPQPRLSTASRPDSPSHKPAAAPASPSHKPAAAPAPVEPAPEEPAEATRPVPPPRVHAAGFRSPLQRSSIGTPGFLLTPLGAQEPLDADPCVCTPRQHINSLAILLGTHLNFLKSKLRPE